MTGFVGPILCGVTVSKMPSICLDFIFIGVCMGVFTGYLNKWCWAGLELVLPWLGLGIFNKMDISQDGLL